MAYIKLAMIFAAVARKHAGKILHINDVNLLTRDLGQALKVQKDILEDPKKSHLETLYELAPQIAEVKVLMFAVTKKLDIDTAGKSPAALLDEIVKKTEERGSKAADDIKQTLDWTRAFFAHEEIQELLRPKADDGKPAPTGFFARTVAASGAMMDEMKKLHRFVEVAKKKSAEKPADDKKTPPSPPAP